MNEVSTYTYSDTPNLTQAKQHFPTAQAKLSNNLLFGERSYYRSKLFTTQIGINPLIAAASPLFILANQFTENNGPSDTYELYSQLQHEIKAFENNAQTQHYRSETILVTRYILCAFLDEMIIYSRWGRNSDWPQHPLLLFFHQETDGGERFFVILERLISDPAIHIDLLELCYLCLSFGFLGKFRHIDDGKSILEQILHRLFDCIRSQRGELKKELNVTSETQKKTQIAKLQFPLWLIASFTCALLLTFYSSFSYMLGNNAEQLYQQMSSLNTNA